MFHHYQNKLQLELESYLSTVVQCSQKSATPLPNNSLLRFDICLCLILGLLLRKGYDNYQHMC
jgi:hypothetical protein